jgi:hypothetical protein
MASGEWGSWVGLALFGTLVSLLQARAHSLLLCYCYPDPPNFP